MICPKCTAMMKTYDRLGIHVEQCDECKGIFLDHGELDQLVAAEQASHAPPPLPGYEQPSDRRTGPREPAPSAPRDPHRGPPPERGYGDSPRPWGGRGYDDSPRPWGGRGYQDSPRPYGGRKRRKSILEQLFD